MIFNQNEKFTIAILQNKFHYPSQHEEFKPNITYTHFFPRRPRGVEPPWKKMNLDYGFNFCATTGKWCLKGLGNQSSNLFKLVRIAKSSHSKFVLFSKGFRFFLATRCHWLWPYILELSLDAPSSTLNQCHWQELCTRLFSWSALIWNLTWATRNNQNPSERRKNWKREDFSLKNRVRNCIEIFSD